MSARPISPRRRRERDLTKAVCLRPADVFALYGIPPSTLHDLCNQTDPARRLTSTLIQGKKGKRGLRLVNHDTLRAYLAKWSNAKKVA